VTTYCCYLDIVLGCYEGLYNVAIVRGAFELGGNATHCGDYGLDEGGRDRLFICGFDTQESIPKAFAEVGSMLVEVFGLCNRFWPGGCHDA